MVDSSAGAGTEELSFIGLELLSERLDFKQSFRK